MTDSIQQLFCPLKSKQYLCFPYRESTSIVLESCKCCGTKPGLLFLAVYICISQCGFKAGSLSYFKFSIRLNFIRCFVRSERKKNIQRKLHFCCTCQESARARSTRGACAIIRLCLTYFTPYISSLSAFSPHSPTTKTTSQAWITSTH